MAYIKKARQNKLIILSMAFVLLIALLYFSNYIHGVFSDEKRFKYRTPDGTTEELTEEEYKERIDNEITTAYTESSKGVLNSATDNAGSMINATTNSLGSTLVNAMVSNFSPTFEAWRDLEKGQSMNAGGLIKSNDESILDVLALSETDFATEMPQAYRILMVSKHIGMVLASILVMFNLYICLFGKADAIKTNVPQILVMYGVSLFGNMLAFKLIAMFMSFMYEIWDKVMSYGDTTLGWHHFMMGRNVLMELLTAGAFASAVMMNPLFVLITSIVFLALIWKFIKGIFRLYCQIIEYYLIYLILLLIFPMVVPTIIAPTTSNIFKSYVRMVVSNTLLLLMTCLMMKTFVSLLINGAFFAGIANYIAGLAFLKVSQSLQQYAYAMGLNSVQATGNFVSAVGNGFGAFLGGAIGTVMNASRLGNYIGSGIKNTGLAMNNERLFEMGMALSNPIQRFAQGPSNFATTAHQTFSDAILKKNDNHSFTDYKNYATAKNSTLTSACDGLVSKTFGQSGEVSVRQFKNGDVLLSGTNQAGNSTNVLANRNGDEIAAGLTLTQSPMTRSNPEIVGSNFMMGGTGYGRDGDEALEPPIIGSDVNPASCQPISEGMIGQFTIDNPNAMFAVEEVPSTRTTEGFQARYSYTIPEGSMDDKTHERLIDLGFKDRGTRVTTADTDSGESSYLTHIYDKHSFVKSDVKPEKFGENDSYAGMGAHFVNAKPARRSKI